MADAAVALDGGIGTLAEISFGWMEIQTGELSPRPLVLIGPSWRETFEAFFRASGESVRTADRALLQFAPGPQAGLQKLTDYFSSRPEAEPDPTTQPK